MRQSNKQVGRVLEILTRFEMEGTPVRGTLEASGLDPQLLRELRLAAKASVMQVLRFDILSEEVLLLVSHPGYKMVIAEMVGPLLPPQSDPDFPKAFNTVFFEIQFSDRLLAYMSWGESKK